MNAFNGLRLIAFIIGGIIGLGFLFRSCNDYYDLKKAQEDFLIVTQQFSKRESGGRFQGSREVYYLTGYLESDQSWHEMRSGELCRSNLCNNLKERLAAPNAASVRLPVWVGERGTIAARIPGKSLDAQKEVSGDFKGGLLLFLVIAFPLFMYFMGWTSDSPFRKDQK